MDRAGVVQSIRLIVELPTDSISESDAGWDVIDRLSKRLATDPRSFRVISITTIADGNRASLLNLPRETRRSLVSSDGKAAMIEILPTNAVSLRGQVDWVRELRNTGALALTGTPGATLLVGGVPALNADYETIVRNHFPSIMALVVGGTLFALLCGFRSLFAAVKAIALNLLSVAASFVFGLSMDYEVFLVARVLEARRSGMSELDAIPEGMAKTAGLITSAAAIMIVVFAGFTFGDFLVVKMIGFTLAVAVLIDATLVRIVIGPALLRLAGDWNWWPGGLGPRKPLA
jgi:RND superfamily putative drug exporter